MIKSRRQKLQVFLVILVQLLLFVGTAKADDPFTTQTDDQNSGLTILNNATNVTKWGLGAGIGVQNGIYKGYGSKVSPVPVIYFDDKWLKLQGTTADVKIGSWSGVSVMLRGQYALFDGYKSSDAPILNGMSNRNGGFWYGPALKWTTAFGDISGAFLVGGNKGERATIDYSKSFSVGSLSITPHAGVEWMSGDYVNYYYGVTPSEVQSGRPAYNGTSTWNMSIGTRVSYELTKRQHIVLDLRETRLGSGISNSPIVGKQFVPAAMFGYVYQFK